MWLSVIILCLAGSVSTLDDIEQGEGKSPVWNTTWTDKLKRDLLIHYDKFARPSQHTNQTLVNLDLMFRHVHLDDTKSIMTVNAWVQMTWKDEKLRWNESDYGGLSLLHLADHEIWEPDIVLYNSATGNNIDHYGNTHVLAYPDGTVIWVPPSQFSAFCEMDLTKWPFDSHTCFLKLGSWTYSGDLVDLQTNESKPVEMELDVSEWKVLSITKKRSVNYYACCVEPYMDIMFEVTVERMASSYHAVILNPAVALALLCLSLFWIPPQAGYRFILSGLTAVLIGVFLVYFSIRLPLLGKNTPLIVLFYSYSLLLVAVSVLISILTHHMSTKQHTKPVPWAITSTINGKLATLLWIPKQKGWAEGQRRGEELSERSTLDEEREQLQAPVANSQWVLLAIAVNRIAFLLYLLLFLSFGLRCLL